MRDSLLSDFRHRTNEVTWKAEKLSPTALCFKHPVSSEEEEHFMGKTLAAEKKHDDKIVKRSDNSIQLSRKSRNGSKCCSVDVFCASIRVQKNCSFVRLPSSCASLHVSHLSLSPLNLPRVGKKNVF
jgi:hypothetical protein